MSPSASFPAFSWSHTRDLAFQECCRQYYWRYYGSQHGWHWAAEEEAQRAYVLKHLATLPMAVGTAIHHGARAIATRIRDQQGVPSASELHHLVRGELNQIWLASRDYAIRMHSVRGTVLREVYYGDPEIRREIRDTRRKIKTCLDHLQTCSFWSELRRCTPDEIILIDSPIHVMIEGTTVYAAPDLVYRRAPNTGVIVDFKTGSARGRGILDQLAVYALCLSHAASSPDIGDWRARLCFLVDGVEIEYRLTQQHLQRALTRIRRSVARMRLYLADPNTNKPKPKGDFPVTAVRERCSRCAFLELCAPELGVNLTHIQGRSGR
jgi:hypothetical protein